jgi:hypothetical protein
LREERRLRVLENRLLRRIFGPMRDEVKGEWTRQHNEELYDILLTKYYSGVELKKNEMGGSCSMYGGGRSAYRILVGRRERRNHLEDLDEDGRIILKLIDKNLVGERFFSRSQNIFVISAVMLHSGRIYHNW